MALNIQSLLNHIKIPYSTSGKNISEGWIGLSCPFCGDTSNHCGISPEGYTFSCWKCGSKGGIKSLIHKLHNSTWKETTELFNNFNSPLFLNTLTDQAPPVSKVEWPAGCTKNLPTPHKQYLTKRGYNVEQMQELFDVRAVYHTGDWKYRLIFPIYIQGVLVSYIGRDITNKSKLKYKNLSRSKSILPVKKTVFNLDSIHETAIICEGVFDAMKFGIHGIATLGLQFTNAQTRAIARRVRTAFIMFDSEYTAQVKANELGAILGFQGIEVEIIKIGVKDPGELSSKEADEIKNELLA